jgi:RNA processing factor Prp31
MNPVDLKNVSVRKDELEIKVRELTDDIDTSLNKGKTKSARFYMTADPELVNIINTNISIRQILSNSERAETWSEYCKHCVIENGKYYKRLWAKLKEKNLI